MTYLGHVRNGVIVLADNASLPDGTNVRIEPVESVGNLATSLRNLKPVSLGKLIQPLVFDDLFDEISAQSWSAGVRRIITSNVSDFSIFPGFELISP